MDLGLNGKVALVHGAGGGLGGAMAKALAAEGARVAVAGRTLANVERTVAAITEAGGTALALQWDLADLSVIEDQFKACLLYTSPSPRDS